jgi:hypothetical protein
MEKENKTKLVRSINWEDKVSIDEVKKDIEAFEKLGATHLDFKSGIDLSDCTYIEIYAVREVLETDEDYEFRKEKALQEKELQKKIDIKKLEDLILKLKNE